MTGHRAREGHRLRVREVIGSQRDIFSTFDVEWQCEDVQSRAFTIEWQCIQC